MSTTPMGEPPKIVNVDRDALNNHRFVEVPDDRRAVAQASAGKVGVAEWAAIVDSDTATELPDGQIGEIWISGQNMGTGYWGKEDETRETFHNILKSRTNPSHAEGATTTRRGCAPATTAPSTRASSTSPAASRTW